MLDLSLMRIPQPHEHHRHHKQVLLNIMRSYYEISFHKSLGGGVQIVFPPRSPALPRNSRSTNRDGSTIHMHPLSRTAHFPVPQPPYFWLHLNQARYPPETTDAYISTTRAPIPALSIAFSSPFEPLSNVLSSSTRAYAVASPWKSRFCAHSRFGHEISSETTAAIGTAASSTIYSRFFGMNLDWKSRPLSALPEPLATCVPTARCNHALKK